MSLTPDVDQRVGVGAVRAVAHQRAAVALRVVVLGLGEAVVDEEGRAARQAVGQRAHEGLGLRVDLGHGSRAGPDLDGRAQVGGPVAPGEALAAGARRRARASAAVRSAAAAPAWRRAPRCRRTHAVASRSGSRSSQCTRSAEGGERLALALAQACPTGRRSCSAAPGRPGLGSSCAASAPEPAPNSQTSLGAAWPASACATCTASARPNSGDISGAVTKSLPDAGICPNLRLSLA